MSIGYRQVIIQQTYNYYQQSDGSQNTFYFPFHRQKTLYNNDKYHHLHKLVLGRREEKSPIA